MRRHWFWFFLLLSAVPVAIIASGLQYEHTITTPRLGMYEGIGSDGWIEDGGTLTFRGLAAKGNRLVISLNQWRPPGVDPAHLVLSRCGTQIGEFVVNQPLVLSFALEGECSPETFTFKVINPFVPPSESDSRALGAQLRSVRVTSDLGVPLVSPLRVLTLALILLVLPTLVSGCTIGWIQAIGASCALFGGALLFALSDIHDWENLVVLLCVCSCLCSGFYVYRSSHNQDIEEGHTRRPFDRWVLWAVFLTFSACALRLYGVDFGFPGRFHPDETPKLNAIERMRMAGDLNPRYFLHPSFLLYLSYFLSALFEALGVESLFDIPLGWRLTAKLAGRTVSVIAGSCSVFLTFLIGRKLYSSAVGLIAAFLLASYPLHVVSSRYMKEDALMTLFLLCVVYTTLVAIKDKKYWLLPISGIAAGLTAGSKYTGALSVAILLVSPWVASMNWKPVKKMTVPLLLALLLVPVAFVVTTPYSILDFEHFSKGLQSEHKHMLRGHSVPITAWSQYWMYHVIRSLLPGMGFFPVLAGFAAVGFLLVRRKREDIIILGMLILFYFPAEWVKAKPAPQPERYMMPLLPFFALATGDLFRVLRQHSSRGVRAFSTCALVVVMIFPLFLSLEYTSEIYNDSRTRMGRWIEQHVPPGSKVLVDWIPYGPVVQNPDITIEMFPPGRLIPYLDEMMGSSETYGADYVVLSSLVYDRFFTQPYSDAVKRTVIRDAFKKLYAVHQELPNVHTFGFHNPVITIFSLKQKGKGEYDFPPVYRSGTGVIMLKKSLGIF